MPKTKVSRAAHVNGYMSTRQAMAYLKVTDPNTIYRYIAEGKLKAHRLGGEGGRRHWRFLQPELDEFLRS